MKQNRYLWALLAAFGLGITGCAKFDPIESDQVVVTGDNAWQETMSIADFKQTFDRKDSVYTINYIDTESEVIIKGRVISTDVAGNIYKYLVIQDTETGEALKVSVDAGSLSGTIPMGQLIAIKCKGLVLGRYADMLQLGIETFNINYKRVEPGRIPYPDFDARVQRIDYPDTSLIRVKEITIPELLAADSTIYGQLVTIKDVHFTGLGDDGERLSDADKIFAPSTFNGTYNIGYPQARQIADAAGNVAYISTSEYARFANRPIPSADEWGSITAIVGWYKNTPTTDGEFQLTIRTLDDLQGFEIGGDVPTPTPDPSLSGDGTQENPYNVAGAVAQNNSDKYAWVKAYIVGQVAGSKISEQSEFAPEFHGATQDDGSVLTYGTNLLIADNAEETNPSNCMVVQLPIGDLRDRLNLVENPQNDSKEVLIYGTLSKYFGTYGLKACSCAIFEGETIGTLPVVTGDAIYSETFLSGTLGDFIAYSVSGAQVWTASTTYGAVMSGFANSRSNANEDWLISPALDLTGKSNVAVSFEHAINKGDVANLKTNHTLWISDDYTDGDPTAATWTQVTIPEYPTGTNWTFVSSGSAVVPAQYLKANVRVAFKYLCSDNESASWEIKNFVVK